MFLRILVVVALCTAPTIDAFLNPTLLGLGGLGGLGLMGLGVFGQEADDVLGAGGAAALAGGALAGGALAGGAMGGAMLGGGMMAGGMGNMAALSNLLTLQQEQRQTLQNQIANLVGIIQASQMMGGGGIMDN